MTPKERQQVLARLAASDVVSLKHKEIIEDTAQMTQDENDAILNIMQNMNVTSRGVAEIQLRQMVRHLQRAALTINFDINSFLKYPPPKDLKNIHERGSNDANYMNRRENVEQKFFKYNNANRPGPQGILDNIRQFGSKPNNPTFEPVTRPKYAALNYTSNPRGPARQYGNSYMELKEHVKHKCTYTAGDSFVYEHDPLSDKKIATFHNLERVIANMEPNPLEWLHNAAVGSPRHPNLQVGRYVEAQVHTEILFNRDVKKLYIKKTDIKPHGLTKVIRECIEIFAKRNGIVVEFIA
ncbi:DUF3626 domain-containing protein [Chitinophaga sp. S165]|uniref:DUF3626 domain-containing protein n=1 Tax=Chitinophaga sp. S165 TaxID=2135462 RepID=UPI000D70C9CA|nr:DUF3626 domain-containing protein [Chitinophaga sp. S165]PWV56150.1 uncharacterized protein DUF3626 [Chitinophaga sp. S165]